MSSIKTRQQTNPFQGPLSKPQTVGKNYGERKTMKASSVATGQTMQRPVDNFDRRRNTDPSTFDPNATFKKVNGKTTSEVPYRHNVIQQMQEGTIRHNSLSQAEKLSTEQCLAICEKVISTPAYHNPQNMRKAAMMGNPVKKSA